MSFYFSLFGGLLRFSSACMECSCMAPFTPAGMVMRGFDLPIVGPKCVYQWAVHFLFYLTALAWNFS